ncbi:c-type cytochrome [Candidatus Reidiella endopervernicosa]|uniref:c-type cytochrome n=1 Tax=Candidatus Reidiella endopervernicosa TaxID=2738883 RepID=UPI001EEFCA40|nr:c-type cytochrome [Candidatus Reidiella endopervernicosa]
MSTESESKSFVMSAIIFIVLFVVVVLISKMMGSLLAVPGSSAASTLEERIAPVGMVNTGAPIAAAAPAPAPVADAGPVDGGKTYNTTCVACHGTGVAGAPKVGDAAAWSARIAQGEAVLFDHAINGYNGAAGFMPAKGGNPGLSDEAVKAAVQHMVENSK